MNSRKVRHLAASVLTVLMSVPSITSADTQALLEFQRDELSFMSEYDPFPAGPVAPVDPLSHKKTDRVLTGPAFELSGNDAGYDYYRYVTFYDIDVKKERIYELPVQREECHDRFEMFASYSYTYTYSATITASASYEGLGLSASLSESRSFSTSRSLRAMGGIIADHTPYFLKQNWEGRTFIQMINSRTKKTEFVKKARKSSPWWVDAFFPWLSETKYPMDFAVEDADWTFAVERTIIGDCDTGFAR